MSNFKPLENGIDNFHNITVLRLYLLLNFSSRTKIQFNFISMYSQEYIKNYLHFYKPIYEKLKKNNVSISSS